MSLTFGRAPFAAQRGSFDFPVPDHVRYWEPWPRRMRAILGGRPVLDSSRGIVLHETGRLPEHYIPLDDLDPDRLIPADLAENGARRWNVRVDDRIAPAVVTAYPDTPGGGDGPPLTGFVTVAFEAMDRRPGPARAQRHRHRVPLQGERAALAPHRRRRPGARRRLEPAPPAAGGVGGRRTPLLLPQRGPHRGRWRACHHLTSNQPRRHPPRPDQEER